MNSETSAICSIDLKRLLCCGVSRSDHFGMDDGMEWDGVVGLKVGGPRPHTPQTLDFNHSKIPQS